MYIAMAYPSWLLARFEGKLPLNSFKNSETDGDFQCLTQLASEEASDLKLLQWLFRWEAFPCSITESWTGCIRCTCRCLTLEADGDCRGAKEGGSLGHPNSMPQHAFLQISKYLYRPKIQIPREKLIETTGHCIVHGGSTKRRMRSYRGTTFP